MKPSPASIGGSTFELPKLAARALANTVELSYPDVVVAHDITFEQIWSLFVDSGFLYPEKLERMQPNLPEIQQTVRALLQSNGDLLSTVVLRQEGMLDAHVSALRAYEQTWMIQHLAALPHTARKLDASARVTLALAYYIQLRVDVRWIKMFYRPNNPWPSRVFGTYARQIADSRTSDLRVFHYLVSPLDGPFATLPEGVRVRAADNQDFELIEDWFAARGRTVELEANRLLSEHAHPTSVSARFRAAGLYRQREVLVAECNDRVAGFALMEISSLGLNFSELTNAFTVYLVRDDREIACALISAAKQRYRQLGRSQCIALDDGEDLTPFEAAGFVKAKDYACWTYHRDHMAGLEEYFISLFGGRRRNNG